MAGTPSVASESMKQAASRPEAAVAEPRLLLLLEQRVEVLPERESAPRGGVPDAEVDQVVAQVRAGQELRREIGHDLGPRIQHGIDRLQVAIEQAVANGQGERHVPVVPGGEPGGDRLLVMQLVGHGGGDRLFAEPGSNGGVVGRDRSAAHAATAASINFQFPCITTVAKAGVVPLPRRRNCRPVKGGAGKGGGSGAVVAETQPRLRRRWRALILFS